MAIHGSITLNGISDREMARIWEFKAKDGDKFTFSPNQLQPINKPNSQIFTGIYNNVVFSWTDDIGMSIVDEILRYLLKKDQREATVANQ